MKSAEFLLCLARRWLVGLGWGGFLTFYGRLVPAKRMGVLPTTPCSPMQSMCRPKSKRKPKSKSVRCRYTVVGGKRLVRGRMGKKSTIAKSLHSCVFP